MNLYLNETYTIEQNINEIRIEIESRYAHIDILKNEIALLEYIRVALANENEEEN